MRLEEYLRVYLIADYGQRDPDLVERAVARALEAGVRAVQFRDKSRFEPSYRRNLAENLKRLVRAAGALFVINDDLELALDIGADGVHLGPNDLPCQEARLLAGPELVIGASAGTAERAVEVVAGGANYLGVGAIFDARGSKPDASQPRGPEAIQLVREAVEVPLVAIGGIGPHNASQAFAAGATGVAVIRSVLDAPQPEVVVKALLEAANEFATARVAFLPRSQR